MLSKKGEKETTKCTPDLQFRKDDDTSGNDGGAESTGGTTGATLCDSKAQSNLKAKAQSSSSGVKSKLSSLRS